MCKMNCKKVNDSDVQPNDYVLFLEKQLLEMQTRECLALTAIRDIIATSQDSKQAQLNAIENIANMFGECHE